MCPSTSLQTSLVHIFFEEMHEHRTLYFNSLTFLRSWQFLQSSWRNSMKNLLESKPFSLKQLPLFWANPVCWMWESQQYAMQSACHTHSILLVSAILSFWTHNSQATTFVVHWLEKFATWLRTCWENVVWSFVESSRAVFKLWLILCHFLWTNRYTYIITPSFEPWCRREHYNFLL